jgi:hypothetical protein
VEFNSISVLRITRCPLPDLRGFIIGPETLVLEDISSEVDLLRATTAWNGETLWLDHCPSFSNRFLQALVLHLHACIEMRHLVLYRLPKFSIILLQKLIAMRNRETLTGVGPAISHLAVIQCDMGKLLVEDENWFRSRLVEFYWIP